MYSIYLTLFPQIILECQVVSDNEIQIDSESDKTSNDDSGTRWENPVLIEDTGKETTSDI